MVKLILFTHNIIALSQADELCIMSSPSVLSLSTVLLIKKRRYGWMKVIWTRCKEWSVYEQPYANLTTILQILFTNIYGCVKCSAVVSKPKELYKCVGRLCKSAHLLVWGKAQISTIWNLKYVYVCVRAFVCLIPETAESEPFSRRIRSIRLSIDCHLIFHCQDL